jgi:DNA-binding transcriptional ArsR family regulator
MTVSKLLAYAFEKNYSKLFNALANILRLKIVKLLHDNGSLSYSTIMEQLNLDVNKDSGKFAYHLQTLRRAKLVTVDRHTKTYRLTSIGKTVADFLNSLDGTHV